MRVRRRDRAARDRSGEGAVRRRARERPAARRRPGEPGGLRRLPRAERPRVEGPRDGARARRAPHARLARQRLRHVVQLRRLPGGSRDRAARHGPRPRPRRRSTGRGSSSPATRRTRATIDFAAFREIADEVGALLWVDASHFIGLVAGGAYPSPGPARRRRDVHHPQGAPGSARRDDRLQGGAREGDRQGRVPDDAGRAARARASRRRRSR